MDSRAPRAAPDLRAKGWPVRRADLLAVRGAARRRAENGAFATHRLRMLELHYYPGNASLTPHMLLEELGVPYVLKLVDRTRNAHKAPEYLRLNPNGLIPVLIAGDLVLYETAAICLHLVDGHPHARLAPPVGTPERAHFYKWLVWLTNTFQARLLGYFYPERLADDPDAVAQVKRRSEEAIGLMLDQLDAELARHGGPWLLGTHYSAVDPYATMLCRWTRGFARPARSLAHLGPYLQRVLARPAVKRAFEQEELPQPWV
jgi:glutathione S-transferase